MLGTHRDISSLRYIQSIECNFNIPETFGTIVHIAQWLSFGDTPWSNSKNEGIQDHPGGGFYDETCL